jgi:uncharacterized protein
VTTTEGPLLGAEPQRTCVGCRRVTGRSELVRFVAGPDGPLSGPGLPGRGAWLCRDERCVDLAVRRGALARALRSDRASVEQACEDLRSAVRATPAPGGDAPGTP